MAGSIQTGEGKDAIPARPLDSCGLNQFKLLVATFQDLYPPYKQNTEKTERGCAQDDRNAA
jgi:hypothetical protein